MSRPWGGGANGKGGASGLGLWAHEPWAGKAGRAEGASVHWGPFMGP